MITLYWHPRTRASRVLWMLEELGEPFETRFVDIRNPKIPDEEGFREASPMGKVPAITDEAPNGTVHMADSAPICLYLADRYAPGRLAPEVDEPARGQFLFWMGFTPGAIEPAMMEKFLGFEVNKGTCGWGNWATMLQVLEDGLKDGPWILGEYFSAADVLLGSSVYFLNQFGLLEENAVFDAYLERCLERPAYRAALARESELE